MKKKKEQWSTGQNCPICKKLFKSENCPHSVSEALARIEENKIKEIVFKTISKKK